MNDDEKIFGIEKSGADFYGVFKYRFWSLYNGTRGAWTFNKNTAIEQGERHQKLIFILHGECIEDKN